MSLGAGAKERATAAHNQLHPFVAMQNISRWFVDLNLKSKDAGRKYFYS